ncbi:hypothetical protein BGZ96_002337 [Linnemannia gamsii]|uniref:Uncharacterized protein n=1 Tax=Linnemannia gamsii TaxID=64522 RepID=A0ABQ7JKR4_9FUNG|nr:hypothetical protein BGZ96_002337 [Linnemannia gamsii]
MDTYHDPKSVNIDNPDPALPPIPVHRDPNRGMYYPCTHPDCNHMSILNTNPAQHQVHCKLLQRDLQAAIVGAGAPQQIQKPQQTTQHTQRRHLHARRSANQPLSSSSSSSHSVATVPRPPKKSTSLNARFASKPSTSTSSQLLRSVEQLTNTVYRFEQRLDRQARTIDGMGKQFDWLVDQVENIRIQTASMEAHTESIRINMDLMEDLLGGLLQDSGELKKELRGLQASRGKSGVKFEDLGDQHDMDL